MEIIKNNSMRFLYYVFNTFDIRPRDYIFKYPIPIRICLENYYTYSEIEGDTKYLYIRTKNYSDTLELVVDDYSKKLLRIQVLSSNHITFYNINSPFNNYVYYSSFIAINIANDSFEKWEKYLPPLNDATKIYVFNDSIILTLVENICPAYEITENNMFSILTDKNLNIIAFVIKNTTEADKIAIKEHIAHTNSINKETAFPFNTCETTFMENKQYLIKKINELENVNQWEILHYGHKRKLINNEFIVDYAIFLLENNKNSDAFIVSLASLLKHELEKVPDLLNKKINVDEVITNKDILYNKIWFYLSLAAQMCAEKIIS